MKQRFQQSLLLMLLMLVGVPLGVWADREVLQPQFGKQVITVASDEVITFKDPKGDTDYTGTTAENAQSLTVFQPAEEGMSVQITFESMNMGGQNSYYSFANVYSGNPDADDTFVWATTTGEVSSSYSESLLPAGNILRAYPNERNKTYTDETYISAAADGSLSVGFAYRYAYSCTGWVAKVKVVKLENMTITGAGSNYEGIGGTLTSKQNVALANAYVTATGVMNPDNVTGIYFTMTQNEGVVDPTALKLFKGDTQLDATCSVVGGTTTDYMFTLNEAPADGTTTFTIKGDILGTAAVGAKVQVDVTKVTTVAQTEGIAPFAAASSVVIENPALVIMTATPQTITVSETPLQFYDEGGKDGGIVSKTNGQVTFLSGVEGQKVMVNFTVNQIWHGSLYNQELRIYSGTEVNAANLIKTLQQGETGIVRSTADDGSLTVVLFSDASNDIAADGFEAEVSLFTPQPMDFNGLTAVAASTETVAAGDEGQDMLTVTVKALNTEPAMQVTKMAFSAGENFALATKAELYFGSAKVGEAVVEGSSFDITLTAPQTLAEGDNLFTLKYTISDEALNDQTVSAQLVSVTALVNNVEKTEAATADAVTRTVKNIAISHANQGTVTKTVNGSIAFTHKAKSEYSTQYEAGTDDRINVFKPKHEGYVTQIEFSEFAIYYYSYSPSSCAKFTIYNGTGTAGEVLWTVNSKDDYTTGPGRVIRSTAADGSLTVVFNPNNSYSTANGFKATVSEYLMKNMAVAAVEAAQASTADASIGAADQDLLTVNVKTDGSLNALTLSGMKLNLKGTEANLAKVSIWQDDTKLGEAAAATEVDVTFGEAVTLAEGDNLFTVKADINADAEENATIDASLVSVHVGTADVAATAGDPEGTRTLKNQVLMTEGDHGTLALGLGKTVAIYDDGGAEGDGADGVEATLTLAPTGEADCLKLTDLGISFAYTAHLYIYKGGEVNDDNQIVDLTGSSAKFEPIVTDADFDGGKLTLKYVGKGSYTRPNFAVQAEGYKKSDVVVTAVSAEDISVSEVLKGQTDVKMLKIAVEAKGELAPAVITAFDIDGINGEALEAYHIYQTGTTTTFSANNEFSESYSITNSGTYYFWLTYDVKATAEVGQTAEAVLNSITVNGNVIEAATDIADITVASGKSGTYTVGANADYATIQDAIDDFGTLGMEGPVVLKIKAGEYNEKVRIPYIKGMGATNTLTIESESGERDVKIYHNQYTTAGYSDDQHKKDYGVITLYEASYVTLKNLEVTTTDKAYKAVVMVKDESRHVTIDNCYLHAPACTASSGEDVCLVGHTIIDEENKNNDYLTVKNCLLEGGKMGISMGGTNYVALPKEVGGIIEGNTFKNNAQKAIYVMDELGVKIKNNTIIIEADAPTKMSVGILDMQLRDEYAEATEITGNIFNVAPSTYVSVMNLRQMEGTSEAPVLIANNIINLASLNASYAAIKFNSASTRNVNVAHNTIRMTGDNGGAAFWASSTLGDGYGNINVVNNIIQNETSGYAVNLYNDGNLGTDKINFQNNLMYTAGETFYRASSGTSGDFASFVEKTGATACINKQAQFVSDDVLEPSATLDGDLLKAVKLSYVATDIQGTVRPEENISIGAYEYDPDITRVPVVAEGYPKAVATAFNEAMITVKADMNGKAYIMVLTADAEAPAAEALKETTYTTTLNKDAEASLKIDTLQEQTAYKAYVLVESTRGNATEVLTTETFTTPLEPIELTIACTEPVTTVASGTETALKVMVASGRAPYTVTWLNSKHEAVGEPVETSLEGEEIVLNITPAQSGDYYVTIKDAQQFEAKDTCRIIVTGEALVADFENLYLAENSHWRGPDTKGEIEEGLYGDDQYQGSFLSGSYKFSNNYSIDWGSWSGFSYSNHTGTTFASYATDQWNSCVGKGYNDSENYAVFFEDAYAPMTVSVLNNPEGEQLSGFYITNAAVTVNSILNGDGQTGEKDANGNSVAGDQGFYQSDYLKLIITADDDDNRTIEYYLADYRNENADEHYYVNDWQWVDLSSLGTVKELSFHLEASRSNAWGYTTPLYFCMDDFNGEAPVVPTLAVADFENIEIEMESHMSISTEDDDERTSFQSGSFEFATGCMSDYDYWYWFGYANQTDNTYTTLVDQWKNIVGGGHNSANYGVAYAAEFNGPCYATITGSDEGFEVPGFYITNSAYAYTSITGGDPYAKKFGEGDWFKLTITGYDAAGAETGTVDYYLADLRDVNNAYVVNSWRYVDLSSLGKVKKLGFALTSSDNGTYGMNTPAYFCFDDMGAEKPESEEPLELLPLSYFYNGPATMEDLELADESFWNGSDGTGSFISGGYRFENGYETSDYGPYAYGWFYSNKTATTFVNYVTDMYNSAAGKGAEDSKTYAVFNVNNWTPKGVEVLAADGEEVSGFYVTNAAYSYTSMINGDDYAKKFGQDDWFKLTVTGYDAAGEQTGTVDFYLADLRDAQASYILKTWRWVDLTSLGKVKRLGFSLSSSDNGDWGMNTPAYFCLDNLGGVKPENEGPIPTGILQLLNSTNGSQQRYDLGGRKLDRQVKGLNIVRMPDGTVRKVMVK
ncbi:MAG: DUF4465 domain-containing protein [Prevotella sp.]|nr:DUF4465 domain-containing protein [Prevotella sp.]